MLETIITSWPFIVSLLGVLMGAAAWAAKVYFMLVTILASIERTNRNLATHQHDQTGRVNIPAR